MRSFRYRFPSRKDDEPDATSPFLLAAGGVVFAIVITLGFLEFGFHLW